MNFALEALEALLARRLLAEHAQVVVQLADSLPELLAARSGVLGDGGAAAGMR